MLTAVIAVLLLLVVVGIVASFLIGAWRERRRYKQATASQSALPAHPMDRHVTAILHMHEGNIMSVEKPGRAPAFILPASWYARRRMLVSLGLCVMIALALFVQGGLVGGGGAIQNFTKGLGLSFLDKAAANDVQPAVRQTASTRLVRIDSADRRQYHNDYQWNVWSYSSCSGIAMEMVMNSYGYHYMAAEILEKEQALGVWSIGQGLLRDEGIALTASSFGFNTDDSHSRDVHTIVDIANKGHPVVVSVRDSHYYPYGHIFVVRGGDDQYVYIADSSLQNFQRMTYPMYEGMAQGFSAVLTPK